MSNKCLLFYLTVIVFSAILGLQASALTDLLDGVINNKAKTEKHPHCPAESLSSFPDAVQALQDMYKALKIPSQLKGWKTDGGDPCGESWTGVSCNGSSVIHIKIPGLELSGSLGFQLSNLHNLKQLDVSSNNIQGEIPYSLPLNITHLNLAGNKFSQNIPFSLTTMKHLRHLNLSYNSLSGPIGNVFTGLMNLREMDLSHNNFTGDLPSSFASLSNLSRLFLESNEFTGSVFFLSDLPLSDLDIQDNLFSGVIPEKFQSIHNLWIGGNRFHRGENYPPWKFPLETMPNISSPPSSESSTIESHPSHKVARHKKKGLGPGGIACMVGGATLLAICAAFVVVIRFQRSRGRKLGRLESTDGSWQSLPISTARDCSSTEDSPAVSAINSPPLVDPRHLPPLYTKTVRVCRRSFAKKGRIPIGAKLYSVAELQTATNSFSEENLLGEGYLGSVYKAEFPNGQIFAVKNINTVALTLHEEERFLDVIWNASRLRHPNIVQLVGYCVEHGQHLLVYEYVRNLTLDGALHCASYIPLPWGLRLRVALGVARALNYLHSTCMPPVAHSNLKAANILLDEDLTPRVCDCGLAVLKSLSSNSIKLKASEMAIGDTGYIAPEQVQPGISNMKGDTYAFGVLLLELFTGRKPFDSSKPRGEQSLVNWASSQLHDNESLEQMVDPAIKRTIPSKALSRFADIVSLCIQPQKEFRPPMSEIVESLMCLLQEHRTVRGIAADGIEVVDPFERSFRSSNSRFFGSPTMSFLSI